MSKATKAKDAAKATAKAETTDANPKKARLELCDWKDGIPVSMLQTKVGYSMKVRPKAVKDHDAMAEEYNLDTDDVLDWLEAIRDALRKGSDVILHNALHAYLWVNPDGVPTICIKTMGNYRKSLSGKAVRPFVRGHETSMETVREMRRARKAELAKEKHEHVTPSTMVKCPKCGNEFRVGKQLV